MPAKLSQPIFAFRIEGVGQALFLTPAPEKTKTQGTNSSQKLKKKTQPLGSNVSLFQKLKKKTFI